jgi:hypothetical protein
LTHLFFLILPNGTDFDIILIDSPIFNRNIVNGVRNMIWWKYSIATTYSPSKVGAALENFPLEEPKKSFWFHVRNQNRARQPCQSGFVSTPSIANFVKHHV